MHRRTARSARVIAIVITLATAVALASCTRGTEPPSTASPTAPTRTPPPGPPAEGQTVQPVLAELVVDDGPAPGGYVRDLFPTWEDTDHDGCDAREQALVAASTVPAATGRGCKVTGGHWVSAYDGTSTDAPGDLDVDHVVPLADAWVSGANTWTPDQRLQYANDQGDLWVVSAGANRSKGDRAPDRWRPPDRDVWCEYARRWVAIKIRWGLHATTPERDALGQMLGTC